MSATVNFSDAQLVIVAEILFGNAHRPSAAFNMGIVAGWAERDGIEADRQILYAAANTSCPMGVRTVYDRWVAIRARGMFDQAETKS